MKLSAKLPEIVQFEFRYQVSRLQTWLFFFTLTLFSFLFIRGNYIHDARNGDFFINAPFVIAAVTVMGCLIWLLVGAAVAGNAASRDIKTNIHPLVYSSPLSKFDYLGGKLLAILVLNAIILLAIPLGIILGIYLPGIEPELLGSFRLSAYLSSYFYLALPSGITITILQFSLTTLLRKGIVSYLVSLLLFITAFIIAGGIAGPLGMRELGKLLDPIGVVGIVTELSHSWTPIEKNTQLIELKGSLLWNRIFWLGLGAGVFSSLLLRFRFTHPINKSRRIPFRKVKTSGNISNTDASMHLELPASTVSFGFTSTFLQLFETAWFSFKKVAKSWIGLPLIILVSFLVVVAIPWNMNLMNVPLLPQADYILTFLAAPLYNFRTPWVIIPFLTIFYAGQVIWAERESQVHSLINSTPVPDWVQFAGKYASVCFVLVLWMTALTISGILVQLRLESPILQFGTFFKILLGIQLPSYLHFALLVFVLHVVVNQKYIGHLVCLIVYGLIAFSPMLGIEHHLLRYGTNLGWSYTEMRGLGTSLNPWFWYSTYWTIWALLIAVIGVLLLVRGNETLWSNRIWHAKQRISKAYKLSIIVSIMLIGAVGGFIFFKSNITTEYLTTNSFQEKRANYELLYKQYENRAQPQLVHTQLNVDIYPNLGKAQVLGTFELVNKSDHLIDSLHVTLPWNAMNTNISFNRAFGLELNDNEQGYKIYVFDTALKAGESLQLYFDMQVSSNGFRTSPFLEPIESNGTYFTNTDWFPSIGYQWARELTSSHKRYSYGLSKDPRIPSPHSLTPLDNKTNVQETTLDLTISTVENQIALGPGILKNRWNENYRSYFHYSLETPIPNQYAFFSANYKLKEETWRLSESTDSNSVTIQIFHHPAHDTNLNRVMVSAKQSLEQYTNHFGPYPFNFLRFVERPGLGFGLHAEATTIDYEEGFSLITPKDGSTNLDLPFYVVAHEVAHQWWGAAQVLPAKVKGAGLLVETPAVYYGMRVLENYYDYDHLIRYLTEIRKSYQVPRSRIMAPLLETDAPYLSYRKGPLSLYALSNYIGEEKINTAMGNLYKKFNSPIPPLATSVDMYSELQLETPDSLRPLLKDLFTTNTFWDLKAEEVTSKKIDENKFEVTMLVSSLKFDVGSDGIEKNVPMNDWIEIGVFSKNDSKISPSYLKKHMIQSGEQTLIISVPFEPFRAGIDPRFLLIDTKIDDNITDVSQNQ